jgi:hypothetical protein
LVPPPLELIALNSCLLGTRTQPSFQCGVASELGKDGPERVKDDTSWHSGAATDELQTDVSAIDTKHQSDATGILSYLIFWRLTRFFHSMDSNCAINLIVANRGRFFFIVTCNLGNSRYRYIPIDLSAPQSWRRDLLNYLDSGGGRGHIFSMLSSIAHCLGYFLLPNLLDPMDGEPRPR